jgi:hypothetical protein
MKRRYLLLAAAAMIAVTVVPASAQDEKNDFSFGWDATFVNRYLWRGFVLNDSFSMQHNFAFGYKGFSVSSWSNFSHSTPRGQKWTEHDLTVDYSHSFGKVDVFAGYIWYAFPDVPAGQGQYTHELYGGVSYEGLLINPSFTYYRDVDQRKGNYFYLSGGHSWELGKGVVLNGGAGIGLNNGMWIDFTTVSNFDLKTSVDIPAGKVVFSPFFQQSIGHGTRFGNNNIFGVNIAVVSVAF